MEEKGVQIATPRLNEAKMKAEPWLDFSSGYVQRALAMLPKQGQMAPWRQNQNDFADIKDMRRAPIEDAALEFAKAKGARGRCWQGRLNNHHRFPPSLQAGKGPRCGCPKRGE